MPGNAGTYSKTDFPALQATVCWIHHSPWRNSSNVSPPRDSGDVIRKQAVVRGAVAVPSPNAYTADTAVSGIPCIFHQPYCRLRPGIVAILPYNCLIHSNTVGYGYYLLQDCSGSQSNDPYNNSCIHSCCNHTPEHQVPSRMSKFPPYLNHSR